MMDDGALFDAAFWTSAGAIVGLLALSGFFSGSETALTAASRGKLRSRADRGSKGADAALRITEDNESLIGSVLLGNNLVNILAASLATALFTRLFGESGVALATLVMTLLVLIFAEVLPKTYAITDPEAASSRVAPAIRVVVIVFAPVVGVVRLLVRGMLRLFGVRVDPGRHILSVRDEIAGAIALGHSEGAVHKHDRDLLLGALDLPDRTVEEVMLHRSQIEMIDAEDDPGAIITQVVGSTHTRLPVYRGERENIVGVLHAKDLLREVDRLVRTAEQGAAAALERLDVVDLAREPYFVPETTLLDDQMREFRRQRAHFALVVDEYGALRGLITLEDILEEIVGEIEDEFDPARRSPLTRTETGDVIADGAMTIRDFNRATDWTLP
ncbi:hypothetical protein C2I36_16515, partial [Rhodobacteraceae bacterium WD3A24]